MPIGINGGYFPAIGRVCFLQFKEFELYWGAVFFNSRTAIAGAIIGLRLVFTIQRI